MYVYDKGPFTVYLFMYNIHGCAIRIDKKTWINKNIFGV